jgi:hypothetical protein
VLLLLLKDAVLLYRCFFCWRGERRRGSSLEGWRCRFEGKPGSGIGETGEEARGERGGESRVALRDRAVAPLSVVVVDVVAVEREGEIFSRMSVENSGGGNTPAISC